MLPHGFAGRVFGWLMERLAAGNYRWVIAQLMPQPPQTYLEIGFGTGRLAEMVARAFNLVRIAGVDPSELMLKTASRKLKRFRKKVALDIKLGDANDLPEGPFDAIVASHTFQFWSNPQATLERIHKILSANGRLIFVIRRHISKEVFAWLPNPISRGVDELAGLRAALADAGFRIVADTKLKSGSQGVVASRA
jgi:ubiquinone/menaquinone biosynthesis C-methylase UbiE